MNVPLRERKAQSWVFGSLIQKENTLKPLCERVETQMQLPTNRLCRYFADSDDPYLIHMNGVHFRGFHVPYSARRVLPQYLLNCFFHPPDFSIDVKFEDTIAFDNLIYIRRSTCDDTTGLVTTYAHELQHVVQHGTNTPRVLAVNRVLREKLKPVEPAAIATDVPLEREANIVSKRIAEILCGPEVVREFAEEQIRLMRDAGEPEQEARWIFFRDVSSSTQYSLLEDTLSLVKKYQNVIDFEIDVEEPKWWIGPLKQPGKAKPNVEEWPER